MNIAVFTYRESFSFALVSFERHLSYSDVGEELYNSHRGRMDGVQMLIIRPPVERSINDLNAERERCRSLIGRFPSVSIYLLYSTRFRLCLSDNLQQGPEQGPFPFNEVEFLEFCRQRELEDFVLQSRAILRSPEQSVYRTPSQEYTKAFLRVGNIQQRRLVLDIIFFWLLAKLQNAGAVLTDSWSISSIALNIGRLLSRYCQTLDPPEPRDNFHVNFLSAYYDGRRGMERETKDALLPLLYANDQRIVFLISAVKTRKSLDILQAEMEKQGYWGKMDVVALYSLQRDISVEGLCRLFEPEFLQKADLPSGFMSYDSPPEGQAVVVIDETTFMPTVPVVRELPLRKELAECSQSFFDRYLGLGAITVHRDARFINGTVVRHHGLFIDVGMLLQDLDFLERLRVKVDGLEKKPDLIIYPRHEQGKLFVDELQRLLGEKFKVPVPIENFASLDEFPETRQTEIRETLLGMPDDALILIADDVMTTGSRLKNYQKFLRELPYAGEIYYLVGVARTQDQSLLNSLDLELRYRDETRKHRFEYVETVFLPDWGRDDCPWCREAKILDDLAEANAVATPELKRSLARRQIELTEKLASGLTEDAFFSVNQEGKARFAGKSVFCEKAGITEAELIARIAATVHFCKTTGVKQPDGRVKLGVEYPVFTIVRSRQYLSLGRTFNDALIMSAILRSCGSQELYAIEDKQLQAQKAAILQLIANGSLPANERCFFIYELLLALKAAKLPIPADLNNWDAALGELLER